LKRTLLSTALLLLVVSSLGCGSPYTQARSRADEFMSAVLRKDQAAVAGLMVPTANMSKLTESLNQIFDNGTL
jgi:uncharacterized membrane protein YvbJ